MPLTRRNAIDGANQQLRQVDLPLYGDLVACLEKLLNDARAHHAEHPSAATAKRISDAESLLENAKRDGTPKRSLKAQRAPDTILDDGTGIVVWPPRQPENTSEEVEVVTGYMRLQCLLEQKGHARVSIPDSQGNASYTRVVTIKDGKIVFAAEPFTAANLMGIGGVLVYESKGHSRPCGQVVGANGSGEYAVVLLGTPEQAANKGRELISALEKDGQRLSTAHLVLAEELVYGHALRIENAAPETETPTTQDNTP